MTGHQGKEIQCNRGMWLSEDYQGFGKVDAQPSRLPPTPRMIFPLPLESLRLFPDALLLPCFSLGRIAAGNLKRGQPRFRHRTGTLSRRTPAVAIDKGDSASALRSFSSDRPPCSKREKKSKISGA